MMHHEEDDDDMLDEVEEGTHSSSDKAELLGGSSGGGKQKQGDINSTPVSLGACGFLSVAYYKPYFDLDTDDFILRLKMAMLPFLKYPNTFVEIATEKPDAYGPIWITTTLVVAVALSSNFASYIHHDSNKGDWFYDFDKVVSVTSLIYSAQGFIPLGFYIACRRFSIPLNLAFLYCMYGYSLSILIVPLLVASLGISFLDWLLFMVALGVSLFFIAKNINNTVAEHAPTKRNVLLGGGTAMQAIFFLCLKIFFF